MKKTTLIFTALVATTLLAFASEKLTIGAYKVDVKKSSLEWFAEKVGGKHNGIIMLSGGEIKNNNGNLSGSFEIDMTTIANTDLEDAGYRAKIENHIKSPDFFDVVKYPKAKFIKYYQR